MADVATKNNIRNHPEFQVNERDQQVLNKLKQIFKDLVADYNTTGVKETTPPQEHNGMKGYDHVVAGGERGVGGDGMDVDTREEMMERERAEKKELERQHAFKEVFILHYFSCFLFLLFCHTFTFFIVRRNGDLSNKKGPEYVDTKQMWRLIEIMKKRKAKLESFRKLFMQTTMMIKRLTWMRTSIIEIETIGGLNDKLIERESGNSILEIEEWKQKKLKLNWQKKEKWWPDCKEKKRLEVHSIELCFLKKLFY